MRPSAVGLAGKPIASGFEAQPSPGEGGGGADGRSAPNFYFRFTCHMLPGGVYDSVASVHSERRDP